MKRWIVIGIFLLGAVAVNAQEKLAFSKVIKADSVSADGIFVSIKEWLSMEFKRGNDAIELEDKEAGLIVAKGNYPYRKKGIMYMWAEGKLVYTINIQIRDGRFKVTLTNFKLMRGEKQYDDAFGVLTTEEVFTEKGAGKKQYNEVWKDTKIIAQGISEDWFNRFASIEFQNYKKDTSEDW